MNVLEQQSAYALAQWVGGMSPVGGTLALAGYVGLRGDQAAQGVMGIPDSIRGLIDDIQEQGLGTYLQNNSGELAGRFGALAAEVAITARLTRGAGGGSSGPQAQPTQSVSSGSGRLGLPAGRTPQQTFGDIGSLEGLSMRQTRTFLGSHGFRFHGRTRGGYTHFRGPGTGSTRLEVVIRPNGQVVRSGPSGARYDAFGKQVSNHTSGEFLGGNFSGIQ